MKILKQVGLLFGLCWASLVVEAALPFAFPSSVIALILLLLLLLAKVVKPEHLREKSDFLLGNLPFFFIPACVGIVEYKDLLVENGLALVVICLVSTVVVYAVTAWSVQLTMRLLDERRKP